MASTLHKHEYYQTEANRIIKLLEKDGKNVESLKQVQFKLDALATRYRNDESLGAARYKLYQAQAMLCYRRGDNLNAVKWMREAVSVNGKSYEFAEQFLQELSSQSEVTEKKIDRSTRIIILFITSGLLTQADAHPEAVAPYLMGNGVAASVVNVIIVYGGPIVSIWLFFEIVLAIDRWIESKKRKGSVNTATEQEREAPPDNPQAEVHNSFRLSQTTDTRRIVEKISSNKWKSKITLRLTLITLSVVMLLTGFYWVSVRPTLARKSCHNKSRDYARYENTDNYSRNKYDSYYSVCLHKNGL